MTKRFLLVDDDADDIELFCEALGEIDAAISCDLAANGKEALEKLIGKKIDMPDIIFLDINMPEMDGWQCIEKLKGNNLYKDIPVIMYSTSSHRRHLQMAQELGAICFFTKPDNYIRLKEVINTVVCSMKNGSLASVGTVIA